jgi:hypothetical protein
LHAECTSDDDPHQVKSRDFSFLVTEDKQEIGPNLSMLGGSSSSSDDDSDDDDHGGGGGGGGGGEGEEGGENSSWDVFEPGSAIDQLLYAQKAVSGMEKRRPGESAEQYLKRKVAAMRMRQAIAGSAEAKLHEQVHATTLIALDCICLHRIAPDCMSRCAPRPCCCCCGGGGGG